MAFRSNSIPRAGVIVHSFVFLLLVAAIPLTLFTGKGARTLPLNVLAWNINNRILTTCPHCKKQGLRPNPFGKNAGECKYCEKLVEYNIRYERSE